MFHIYIEIHAELHMERGTGPLAEQLHKALGLVAETRILQYRCLQSSKFECCIMHLYASVCICMHLFDVSITM